MGRAKRQVKKNQKRARSTRKTRWQEPCGSCHSPVDLSKHAYVRVPNAVFHWDCSPKEFKKPFYDEE